MAPRLHVCTRCLGELPRRQNISAPLPRYATVQAVTPTPDKAAINAVHPISRFPNTQPPSHKPAEFRRSQLHRQYTSLLKSTPLMLILQHNNLRAVEWAGIRRELGTALRTVDKAQATRGAGNLLADHIKLQIIHTGVFSAALRIAEYYHPAQQEVISSDNPRVASSVRVLDASADVGEWAFAHSLSRAAHEAVFKRRFDHPLVPLLHGPIAILTFPSVSTEHLKAALSILAPSPPYFPAPTRRAMPNYYESQVQAGVHKLMLLGARIEGNVFDLEKTRWVGTISGGLEGLRAEVVHTLQSASAAVTGILAAASKNLYFTLEGRKAMLEEAKGPERGEKNNCL